MVQHCSPKCESFSSTPRSLSPGLRLGLVIALLTTALGILPASVAHTDGPDSLPLVARVGRTMIHTRSAAEVASTESSPPQTGSAEMATPDAALVAARVTDGQLVLYTFEEGSGTTVYDVSGVGTPLDLTVGNASAVSWVSGGLVINASTVIASGGAATKVIEAARTTNEITVEAWVRPANTSQDGPARIVTLSADLFNRNFTLGQGLWGSQPSDLYDMRLRTTTTSDNGMPSLSTPSGSLTAELTHVVYTRDASGQARIYLNGVERASGAVGGNFSNWSTAYLLALANEPTGDRPWLGEFRLVAIYSRALSQDEVDQNFQDGPDSTENERPVSIDDTSSTDEEVPITIGVLGNDRDPNGDALSVSAVGLPTYGGVSTDGTALTYTPANRLADYMAVLTYTVSDGSLTDTAIVTVTVTADDDAPITVDDVDTTDEDTPVAVSVLTNDSDPEGNVLAISAVGAPTYGSASTDGNTLTYTPANRTADYTDVLTYTASDGTLTGTSVVTVMVVAEDDPPVAVDDNGTTDEDTPLTVSVLTNDNDPEGLVLSVSAVGVPAYGSASTDGTTVTYSPINRTADYMAVFNYTVSDGKGVDTATVTVLAVADNDPPLAVSDATAVNAGVQTTNLHAKLLSNDTDPDTDDNHDIVAVDTSGTVGAVTFDDATDTLVYTASGFDSLGAGVIAIDTFSYTMEDSGGSQATATVTVAVVGVDKDAYYVYLPFTAKSYVFAPDLVVERITATSDSVQLVIRNQGHAPVANEFWIDVYIDPDPIPTAVNQVWTDLCDEGLVWGITADALPLLPGDAITLTIGDIFYVPGYSSVSWPLATDTPVYAQVDSADIATAYGAILETHEITGGEYNNISSTLSTADVTGAVLPPANGTSHPSSLGGLPPR